jgi:glycosyltransferase involved in cell wall biosynthesis
MADAGVAINILLVDDGSRDQTTEVIRQLVQDHEQVKGLILTRNFGHQAAISVGLRHARGHAIAVMDADLQDKPVDLLALARMAAVANGMPGCGLSRNPVRYDRCMD